MGHPEQDRMSQACLYRRWVKEQDYSRASVQAMDHLLKGKAMRSLAFPAAAMWRGVSCLHWMDVHRGGQNTRRGLRFPTAQSCHPGL